MHYMVCIREHLAVTWRAVNELLPQHKVRTYVLNSGRTLVDGFCLFTIFPNYEKM